MRTIQLYDICVTHSSVGRLGAGGRDWTVGHINRASKVRGSSREAASAAASDLRAAKVAKKRLEGKEREQQQKKEKAGKKQKA